MGMDLSGSGGYFRWANAGWASVLELAEHYGWQPTGTGPPRRILKAEWGGHYFGNDGALFYARDAERLADALERALELMPAKRPRSMKTIEAYDFLASEAGKQSLRKFISYCRAGSFRMF